MDEQTHAKFNIDLYIILFTFDIRLLYLSGLNLAKLKKLLQKLYLILHFVCVHYNKN